MPTLFKWMLHPQRSSLASVTDEFTVGDFHLRLRGLSLEVEAVADCTEEAARRLADEYVGLLRSHGHHVRLLTSEEFSSLPAQPLQAVGPDPREKLIAVLAIRAARSAVLASSDAARHAPSNLAKNVPPSRLDQATALKYTQDILRAYEQHLRR